MTLVGYLLDYASFIFCITLKVRKNYLKMVLLLVNRQYSILVSYDSSNKIINLFLNTTELIKES